MPLSTRISLSPSSMSRHRSAQLHKLFSSAGFTLFHIDLGTTPNMAPPSSLKKPVSMEYSFICSLPFQGLAGIQQKKKADNKKDDQNKNRVPHRMGEALHKSKAE